MIEVAALDPGASGAGGIGHPRAKDPAHVFTASTHATNSPHDHGWPFTVLPFYGTAYRPPAHRTVESNNLPVCGAIAAKAVNVISVANVEDNTAWRTKGAVGTVSGSPDKGVEGRELTDATEKITGPQPRPFSPMPGSSSR